MEVKEGGVVGRVWTWPGDATRLNQDFGSKVLNRDIGPQGKEENVALDEAITREMPERKTAPGVKHLPREGGGDVAGSGLWEGGREESCSDEVI